MKRKTADEWFWFLMDACIVLLGLMTVIDAILDLLK